MKGLSRSLALPLSSILICIVAVVGCSTVGFYTQAVGGQLHLITHRVAVSELIDSSATPDELRARLERIEAILAFAEDRLALPVGDRYRSYVDVDKPFLVWNVVAAPEFETAPLNRCYPIIGCAAYRGYFNEKGALKEAERLRDRGFDVHVGGAAAYSTLGWFDDPIVSTFADWRTERLAELLFHELAHSVVYLKNDTAFNEAFASFVGEQGVGMWLGPNGLPGFERAQRDEKQLFALLAGWRERLDTIYAEDIPMAEKRRRKEARSRRCARATRCTVIGWGAAGSTSTWRGRSTMRVWRQSAPISDTCLPSRVCFALPAGTGRLSTRRSSSSAAMPRAARS